MIFILNYLTFSSVIIVPPINGLVRLVTVAGDSGIIDILLGFYYFYLLEEFFKFFSFA